MCLIIAKKAGVALNSQLLRSAITTSCVSNKDGFGYMIKRAGAKTIDLDKGFFDPEELIEQVMGLNVQIGDELVVHLRAGTSGKKDDINCHPFVISHFEREIEETAGTTKHAVIAHNGVMGDFTKTSSDFSDTYHFVKSYLSLIKTEFYKKVLTAMGYNKYAVLYPTKALELFGSFILDSGLYFSNAGYKGYGSTSRTMFNNNNNAGQMHCRYDNDGYGGC